MDLPIPIAFPSQTGHLCVRLQLPCRALLEAFGYRGTHRKNHGIYHGIYNGIVYSWYVTLYWLVVGNIFFFLSGWEESSQYIGNVIIPTDFHIFQGVGEPPTSI